MISGKLLKAGKQVDLIILDQNIFDVRAEKIRRTRVLMAFFAGDKVYQRQ